MNPIFSYMGSKKAHCDWIFSNINVGDKRLVEPFAGSCTVSLYSEKENVWINDRNHFITDIFSAIQSNYEEFYKELYKMSEEYYSTDNPKEYYINVRKHYSIEKDILKKSVQEFFLLVAGFNSLIRFNKKGIWSVAFGQCYIKNCTKKNFPICNTYTLEYLKSIQEMIKNWKITNIDYIDVIKNCNPKTDFLYCDPPYLTSKESTYFRDWTEQDTINLSIALREFSDKGGKFAMSECFNKKEPNYTKLLQDSFSFCKILQKESNFTICGKEAKNISEILIINEYN